MKKRGYLLIYSIIVASILFIGLNSSQVYAIEPCNDIYEFSTTWSESQCISNCNTLCADYGGPGVNHWYNGDGSRSCTCICNTNIQYDGCSACGDNLVEDCANKLDINSCQNSYIMADAGKLRCDPDASIYSPDKCGCIIDAPCNCVWKGHPITGYCEEYKFDYHRNRTMKCTNCNKPKSLDADFDVSIDIKEENDPNSQEAVFIEEEDMRLIVGINSPEAEVYVVKPEDSVERKQKCSLPNSFTITVQTGAWYYDSHLIFKDLDVDHLIKENRKIIHSLSSILGYFIKEAGEDPDDYFVSDDEIFTDMIGHHINPLFVEGDDSIEIMETLEISGQLINNNEIQLQMRDFVQGSPRKTSVYKEDWSKGVLFMTRNRVNGPPITIAKGPLSLRLYSEMITNLAKELQKIDEREEFKSMQPVEILNEDDGSHEGWMYPYPTIKKNTLDNLKDFLDVLKTCCKKECTENDCMPKIKIDIECPKKIEQLNGELNVDLNAIDEGTWYSGDNWMEEPIDADIRISLKLENMEYDPENEDILYSRTECGVPQRAELSVHLHGFYYDFPGGDNNVNFFAEVREGIIESIPGDDIMYLFEQVGKTRSDFMYEQEEVINHINNGNIISSWKWPVTDESKEIDEFLELIIELFPDGKLTIEIKDNILVIPRPENHRPSDRLEQGNPFSPRGEKIIVLAPEGSRIMSAAAMAGIVKKIIKNIISLESEHMFLETTPLGGDWSIGRIEPNSEFKFTELKWYLDAKNSKKCCHQGKQESEHSNNEVSSESSGLSIYYLRDNPQMEGLAYYLSSNKEITTNITKTFITDFNNLDYSIYKAEDLELKLCNYTTIGHTTHNVGIGNFTSSDNLFKITTYEDSAAVVNITTINITYCGLFNLDEFIVESGEEFVFDTVNLTDVMVILKQYSMNLANYYDVMSKINGWQLSYYLT